MFITPLSRFLKKHFLKTFFQGSKLKDQKQGMHVVYVSVLMFTICNSITAKVTKSN